MKNCFQLFRNSLQIFFLIAGVKDNQVPVCPLCNSPCPVKKGQSPDTVVGQHIDNECQSDPAKQRRKVSMHACLHMFI